MESRRPRADERVKYDTVIGTIGNTHGVRSDSAPISAASPTYALSVVADSAAARSGTFAGRGPTLDAAAGSGDVGSGDEVAVTAVAVAGVAGAGVGEGLPTTSAIFSACERGGMQRVSLQL